MLQPVRQVYYLSRRFNIFKQPECVPHHGKLLSYIPGFSKGVAKGPAEENRPWGPHLFCELSKYRYGNSGNTCLFYDPLYQSDRLITYPSAGG